MMESDYAKSKYRADRRKPRRKPEDSESSSSGVSSKQALIYFAIILACFVVVYPRMIHPMLKYALGFTDPVPSESSRPDIPPQIQNRGKPIPGGGPGMHPLPGARGEHMHTESSKGGSGGGVMAMVLPLYAGGIFLYLIYTGTKAYKSHGTKESKKDPQDEVYSLITEKLANLDLEKILTGEDTDGAEEINKLAEFLRKKHDGDGREEDWEEYDDDYVEGVEVVESSHSGKTRPQSSTMSSANRQLINKDVIHNDDTDELLRKCEKHEHMTPEEMVRLQTRLLEVEGRMNKLMSAIQTVQTKVSDVAEEVVSEVSGHTSSYPSANHNQSNKSQQENANGDGTHVSSDDVSTDGDDQSSSDDDEVDRLEVEDIYDELVSSEDEDTSDLLSSEMSQVRKRNFPTEASEC